MTTDDHEPLLNVSQALAIVDAVAVRPRTEMRDLMAVIGCRLAEEISADRDYPPFAKALMDGFAVCSADVREPPVDLRITARIAAGQIPNEPVKPGEAMAIMTGAPVPEGADVVIPVENTRAHEPSARVTILRAEKPGQNIARRGSDVAAQCVVLANHQRLGPAQIAVAASVGRQRVLIHVAPRVAVLATGDELAATGGQPGLAQIRNANNPMLIALLQSWGCPTIDLGQVVDDPNLIETRMRSGLQEHQADVLLVSGGMSMGQFDYVPRVINQLGFSTLFTKLAIKPGKPLVFAEGRGTYAGKFIFGLPGNPVSAFVCTVLFTARLVGRMSGAAADAGNSRWITGRISEDLPANGWREFYQPALLGALDFDGLPEIRPLKWKGSADLFTLARADGLLARPANDPAQPRGAVVRLLYLQG